MITINANDFTLTLAVILLVMGVITFLVGIIILAFKVKSDEFTTITEQSAKLMEKGIVDNVSELMGSTSSLLETINQMVKTKAGVGVFLVLITFILFGVAYYLITSL
ncbi:MAG: hypothetical protein C4545_09150 [Anaerolineaceae bacterium]|jgi:hypothetical protein|nr:MAG: hypothetical protein C4545_09150 [Anaerolineaceae bacterium]